MTPSFVDLLTRAGISINKLNEYTVQDEFIEMILPNTKLLSSSDETNYNERGNLDIVVNQIYKYVDELDTCYIS